MEDLIKREDALKAFYDNLETSEAGTTLNDEAYLQALENLPSVERNDEVIEELVRKKDVEALLIFSDLVEQKTCGEIAKALQALPTIKPKQGKWIPLTGMQPPELHGKHYCSNCDLILHLKLNGGVYNYCPNCGARMVK